MNVTRQEIEKAMQIRIEDGKTFQAKDISKVGNDLRGTDVGTIDGMTMPMITDRLLQWNRKHGSIYFERGFWHRVS